MTSSRTALSIPATKEYASVVRTTATALAALFDADIYLVENVRQAVDEAFVQAVSRSTGAGSIDFTFEYRDGVLTTCVFAENSISGEPDDFNESISRAILSSFCDECHIQDSKTWTLTMSHNLRGAGGESEK